MHSPVPDDSNHPEPILPVLENMVDFRVGRFYMVADVSSRCVSFFFSQFLLLKVYSFQFATAAHALLALRPPSTLVFNSALLFDSASLFD